MECEIQKLNFIFCSWHKVSQDDKHRNTESINGYLIEFILVQAWATIKAVPFLTLYHTLQLLQVCGYSNGVDKSLEI